MGGDAMSKYDTNNFIGSQTSLNEFTRSILLSLNTSEPQKEIIHLDGKWFRAEQYLDMINRIRTHLLSYSIDPKSVLAIVGKKNIENLALIVAAWSLNYSLLILPVRASTEFQNHLLSSSDAFLIEIDSEQNLYIKRSGATHSDSEDTGLLLPTSGTTGVPKLVKITFQGMMNFAKWARTILPTGTSCRVLSYAPLNFDLSLLEVWSPLIAGGRVVVADESKMTHSAYLRKLIEEQQVNVLQGVSGLYRTLLQGSSSSLNYIKLTIITGEKFPLSLVHQIIKLLPGSKLMNIYGSTETNDSFVAILDKEKLSSIETLPIGQRLPGVEFTIDLSHDHDKGELLVHTPFMSAGYCDKNKTAEKFFTDEHGRRWFRTGDLASVNNNGELQLHGRIDHQIKVDGVRINLSDIEMVLLLHPDIRAAVVWARVNDLGENRVTAVINTINSKDISPLSLRKYCSEHLPTAAIPKRMWITDEEIPLGNNGKYDTAKLELIYGG